MKVTIRPASPEDARLLHDWANRPDSLAASLRTGAPIPWERHRSWLAERMADPETRIAIAEADGVATGQVRVQRGADGPEVSIFVDPGRRRSGVALALLAHAASAAAQLWPGAPLLARVKPGNAASLALFARAGYRLHERRRDHLLLERRPA
jgi:UDP-2,4-diacetamido-2,4,6-trideoxy-beta-L-altropyranose hydrolase